MIFSFLDYELDTDLYEIRRGGKPRMIEPKSFDLLLFLVRNHDRVVSKDEIFRTVWPGRVISDATLSSCINAVRSVVGDDGRSQSLIKTFPRRGFRFVADVDIYENLGDDAGEHEKEAHRRGTKTRSDSSAQDNEEALFRLHKPSIAVLPFNNFSEDPDQEFLTDGITEDIITALSAVRWLYVIARSSSFKYKNASIDIPQIAKDLGVDYVLEGSVRRVKDDVRVSVQLVDGTDNVQIWAHRYDLGLREILSLQAEITQTIVGAIEPELGSVEREKSLRPVTGDIDAWAYYQQALFHLYEFTPEGIFRSHKLFKKAIDTEPRFGGALSGLAYSLFLTVLFGYTDKRDATLNEALGLGRSALSIDYKDPYAHFAVGRVLTLRGEHDNAIAELETALELNPSFAQAYFALGFVLVLTGNATLAIRNIDFAIRLSPHDPLLWACMTMKAFSLILLKKYDEAVVCAKRGLRQPKTVEFWLQAMLASALGQKGDMDKASAALNQVLSLKQDFSVEFIRSSFPVAHDALLDVYLRGLYKAGLR